MNSTNALEMDMSSAASSDMMPGAMERKAHPTESEIRERAYYIYKAHNGSRRGAIADWIQAERELNAKAARANER